MVGSPLPPAMARPFGAMIGSMSPPQMMSHFLSRFQPGAVVSAADLLTLRSALTLAPDSPASQRMVGYVEMALKEVESSAAAERREMMVSEPLYMRIQMVQPYLEERVTSPLAVSAPQVVAQLRALLAPSGQTPMPAAARLAGGVIQMGRRGRGYSETNAVSRYLQRLLTMEQDVPLPDALEVAGHRVTDRDDPVFAQKLEQIFGEGVTLQVFLNAIRLVPGYRYMNLYVFVNDQKELTVNAIIVPESSDEPAGAFNIVIPPMPAEDETWAALGQHFFINPAHRKNGIGGNLLLQFAAFLAMLQIDGLDAPARTNGRAYWASRGFELKNHRALEDLKKQFAHHLVSHYERHGLTAARIADVEMRIASIRDVGQLAGFKLGEEFVGYVFLEKVISRTLELRFQLKFNYFGWLRMIPEDRLYPPEWDDLPEGVRQSLIARFERGEARLDEVMVSDQKLGHYLSNWVSHVAQQLEPYLVQLRKSLEGAEEAAHPSDDLEGVMRNLASFLNMMHRLQGQHVEYYFKRYTNWMSLTTVVEAIRGRGIAVDYQIPDEDSTVIFGR